MATDVAGLQSASLAGLLKGTPTLAAVAGLLDGLSPEARSKELRSLSVGAVQHLWNLTTAADALGMEDVVPSTLGAFKPRIWAGINSMPLFRTFEKRMYRDAQGLIWGYNEQMWKGVSGPGYFSVVVHPSSPGSILVDYHHVPEQAPPGWPTIQANEKGIIGPLFYGGLTDELRRVGKGTVAGMARKYGNNFFFAMALQDG